MTATDYTAKARELVRAAYEDFGVGLPDLEPMTAKIATALRKAAEAEREKIRKHVHGAFYTERDPKAPGVWLFCRYRDTAGVELIQDDRLFPRHADAQKQVDAFVAALFESIDMGHPERNPVVLDRGEAAK